MTHLKSIKPTYILFLFMTMTLTLSAKDQAGFDLALGVVVDSDNEMLYVSHREKGMDAISIASGDVVWHSDQATRPIMIRDGQLVALANATKKGSIDLVSFDISNGSFISKKSFTAPSNVLAYSSEGLEHKFKIKVNYDTNPLGDIQWSYSYEVAQGMAQQKSLTEKKKDNKTYGKINFSQTKTASGLSVLGDAKLKTLSQKPKSKSIAIEGKFIQQEGRQFTSVSKKHILVSQVNNKLSTWEKYKWDIYNMNNQYLGSFIHYNSYRPFEVVGDTVLLVTSPATNAEGDKVISYPFMINAYSLSRGTQKWTQEIKDHRYQGVYPH
jgi:hypothetical protein